MLNRWKSPSERSLYELRNPNPNSGDDINNLQAFRAEITHRFSVPLNTLGFSLVVLTFMLSMRFFRVENYGHTVKVFVLILCLEVISIMAANLSIKYENMQIINFLPFILSILLSFYFFEITRKIKS